MKKIFISTLLICCFASIAMAQMPDLVLKDIHGKKVAVNTLGKKGKPVIIDFFATWCKPCLRELNAIADVYDDWQKETGCQLVAVSIDRAQNVNKVAPLVSENDWPFEMVLLDPNSDLQHSLSILNPPYVLILDGNGKIVFRHNGYKDGDEKAILAALRKLKKKTK